MHTHTHMHMHAHTHMQYTHMHTLHTLSLPNIKLEHCGGEPEQAANMHMNRLSFTLK